MRAATADSFWTGLFLAGAVAAFLTLLMMIVPIALVFSVRQPPLSGGAALLRYIDSNKVVYVLELVTFVGMGLPALVVFLSLATALKDQAMVLAAIGGVIGVGSEIIALAERRKSWPGWRTSCPFLSPQDAMT